MKKTFDALSQALPHIRQLQAYVPGEQPQGEGWIKLNTNENPYPPSPKVLEAISSEAPKLRLYPEPLSRKLRAAIGERVGLSEKHVIIGNGSDNLLDLITRCFAEAPGVGHTVPSYSLYPVVAAVTGQELTGIEFERGMRLDLEAIAAARAKVFFLTNPNAPTGVLFSLEEIEALLRSIDGLLVVDEAYIAFGGESAVSLIRDYENLIVVRTFSKSYSLAGMRVGFALAAPGVIEVLDRVRDAYNVDRIAQAAALAAFRDESYFEETRNKVIRTRENVACYLRELGWFTYPSSANFLFTEPVDRFGEKGASVAREAFESLKAQRILVRYFPGHPLTCAFIRVTVGTDAEMDTFKKGISKWLENASRK